jgi:predicted DNA-binding transcriptional regulator AlpA
VNSQCAGDKSSLRIALDASSAGLSINGQSIDQLPMQSIPSVLSILGAIETGLAARLLVLESSPREMDHDQLLSITVAAIRLGVSKDWLYRRAAKLPFTVRQGRLLRFSERGIEDYIRRLSRNGPRQTNQIRFLK